MYQDRVTSEHVSSDTSSLATQFLNAYKPGNHGEGYCVLALPQEKLAGLVFDVDGTIYINKDYRTDVENREIEAIASAKGWDKGAAPSLLRRNRDRLSEHLGRPARLTETIAYLNLSKSWWNDTRNKIYRPEVFLKPSPVIAHTFRVALDHGIKVAVATNSPSHVATRILHILGIDQAVIRRITIVGPDTLGTSKPDQHYFRRTVDLMQVCPEQCLSVGDDIQNDGLPAISIGMGAAIVTRTDHVAQLVNMMTNEDAFKPVDLEKLAMGFYKPNTVSVIGVTGRAGAGKTTLTQKLSAIYDKHNIRSVAISLDSFFKLSSTKRREWLRDRGELDEVEYNRRVDQLNWWDFERFKQALTDVKAGRRVTIEGVYNREDKGELTGVLEIGPYSTDNVGTVCLIEGVAVLHLKMNGEQCMFVAAHPAVRIERILGRDKRSALVAKERFRITQNFEDSYFGDHADKVDVVVQNDSGALRRGPVIPQM